MKQILSVATALVLLVGAFAIIQTPIAAEAKNVNCGDLKTLILKFNQPVHDFNVNVCPSGGGGVGPAGPAGANGRDGLNGLNGRDGTNGMNGTSLPADVIDKVNMLSSKAAVLDQIVAAYQNGSLGNGGVSIGCIEFPNGTAIGDCPPAGNQTGGGNQTTPPIDNGTVVVPPVNQTGNQTGGNGTVVTPPDNGTVITPPIDNGTVIVPPNNGTVVVPPENGTIPIDNGTVTPPPDNGTVVVTPPDNGTVVVEPPVGNNTNTTTVTPPDNGTVVIGPSENSTNAGNGTGNSTNNDGGFTPIPQLLADFFGKLVNS